MTAAVVISIATILSLLSALGIAADAWRIRRRAEAERESAQQIGTQVAVAYTNTCAERDRARELREQTEQAWRDAEQFVTGGA